MATLNKSILKAFSPRIAAKALLSMDKSVAIIVSACWAAAIVTLILAVLAVHGAVAAKKEAADALAAEPVLPVAVTNPVNARDLQNFADRLQRQFPDLKIELLPDQNIALKSSDGAKFHQWITALGYIDTMTAQVRWSLSRFCVGNCNNGQDLMFATVHGQKVVFSLPQS